MASLVPGAATPRLRSWLERSSGSGSVLHAGRDAVYADVLGRCVAVLGRAAVHVPCGVRTTLPALPAASPGDPVGLRDGVLTVAGCQVQVVRTVPVPHVRPRNPERAHAALRHLLLPRIDAVLAELDPDVLGALAVGDAAVVPALLGRGSGLTPLGDDVLCGWLATRPAPSRIAAEVARLAPHRTTMLSAALLDCARHGETVPQFRRLVAVLDAAPPTSGAALDDLLRIGHTSGAGLALGCLLALSPVAEVAR